MQAYCEVSFTEFGYLLHVQSLYQCLFLFGRSKMNLAVTSRTQTYNILHAVDVAFPCIPKIVRIRISTWN